MMRSLLFTPGDSLRKMERSATSAADAQILELEDSVAEPNKPAARDLVRDYLSLHPERLRQKLCVRISPLSSPQRLLDALQSVPSRPEEAEMTDLIATNEATTTGEAFERGVSIYSARHQTREAGSTAAFEKQPTVRESPDDTWQPPHDGLRAERGAAGNSRSGRSFRQKRAIPPRTKDGPRGMVAAGCLPSDWR